MPVVIPVRTHYASQDLWFDPRDTDAQKGDHVVVTTERGTEFGLATDDPFEADDAELRGELKPVLRVATDADVALADSLARKGDEAMPVFRQLVKEQGLDMKPVGVEFLFGGERAVFYFAAEERVDFRDLVRTLASRFHKRVDMRQIGVRDEVRLRGGFGPCGQELCCARFGGKFEPVSIRMAKEQDLPLNSAKISGMCGRLMCCLRYEFEAYKDFKSRAPKRNALIETPLGLAKVVDYNTPREMVTMRLENGKSFTVPLSGMRCSEGCRKRAEQQHIPLRPDTVTREALEALGTAEIMAQLADLDRKNNPTGLELDSSLLVSGATPKPAPRQRRSGGKPAADAPAPAPDAPAEGGARRPRGRGGQQVDDRPAQRKGMRPRRSAAAQAQAEQAGQQGRPARRSRHADEQPAPRERDAQQSRRQQCEEGGAAEPQQPARRTRRHHVAGQAEAPQTATPRREQRVEPRATAGDVEGDAAQRRRRRHHGAAEGQTPVAPGQPRPRTQAAPPTGEPDGRPRRRRRRPGDKGGDKGGPTPPTPPTPAE